MKLLILTQYYPPEIGAPQNRLHELAVRLKEKGVTVEVLTALPNYPEMEVFSNYKNGDLRFETIDGIKVIRSWIYVSKNKSVLHRLLTYFSFVASSLRRGWKLEDYDFLVVESPPLFLGISAYLLSKKLEAKLIFNVSDLWPESAEKLKIVNNRLMLKLAYKLERFCYLKSHLVTGQTMGIVNDIKGRFPNVPTYWLPNGVDLNFFNPDKITHSDFRKNNGFTNDDVLFFYGGILGHAQGLDVILKAACLLTHKKNIHFILQGAGPLRAELLQLASDWKLSNVHFLPPVSKSEMPGILKNVDVALVPLKKLLIFEGAIPSKIFESLAMKLPIILGVDGEAKSHFIDRAEAGIFVEPENVNALVSAVNTLFANKNLRLQMGENARMYVSKHFDRNQIASDFYNHINKIL
jgi:glycosyltransferase involved in cell wall biosynthesis